MSVGTSLRRLGEFLEECERTDAASVRESSVTIDQLADAANDAKTVYEFGKALDLERMDALDLLQDLDLLEFVMGRLTTDDDPDVSREDVVARIRQSAGET